MAIVQQIPDGPAPYYYDQVTPEWKETWSTAPCSTGPGYSWPGYATIELKWQHRGGSYTIQLWKGYCQQFGGRHDFPGGWGAEVGVYGPGLVSWDPRLEPLFPIKFKLYYEKYCLVDNDFATTWWQTQWMQPPSYAKFVEANGGASNWPSAESMTAEGAAAGAAGGPAAFGLAVPFTLEYWIDGKAGIWKANSLESTLAQG